MSVIKKDEEYVKDLCRQEGNDEYEFVEEKEWISEGKYEYSEMIFKDKEENFWLTNITRTGSHYTDWHYSYEPELIQVRQEEVIKKVWKAI